MLSNLYNGGGMSLSFMGSSPSFIKTIGQNLNTATFTNSVFGSLSTNARFSTVSENKKERLIPKSLEFLKDAKANAYPAHGPLPNNLEKKLIEVSKRPSGLLSEHEAYDVLEAVGISGLPRVFLPVNENSKNIVNKLKNGQKYVLKAIITDCIHKTDIGAITFSVTSENAVAKIEEFRKKFSDQPLEGFLFCEQLDFYRGGLASGEYLLSSYLDPDFGPMLCFGIGGTGVEYSKTVMKAGSSHAFIPAKVDISKGSCFGDVLDNLPATQIISGGVRGIKAGADVKTVRSTLQGLQKLVTYYSADNPKAPFIIEEIEVNPIVTANEKLYALDAVLKVLPNPSEGLDPERVKVYDIDHTDKPIDQISALLKPKSAVVIGASERNPSSLGATILDKLKLSIPNDQLYCIHPKESSVHGIKAYKSLTDVVKAHGGPVDLFVVGIPAASCGKVIADAVDKNECKCILTISGGFSETKEGAVLEKNILDAIQRRQSKGLPRPIINGPNTVGSYSAHGSDTVFTPSHKSSREFVGAEDCALIAQSGAFMITRLSDLGSRLNPEICLSVGNAMDISSVDCLEYLLDHEKTSVIGMYMEGFKKGECLRLMNLVARARKEGRVIVMYKSARSKVGKKAAQGHTASMAGDYDLFAGLMEHAGAIVCSTVHEFEQIYSCCAIWGKDRLKRLNEIINKPGKEKIVVRACSNAGFEAGSISDHLFVDSLGMGMTEKTPVSVPDWNDEEIEQLNKIWDKYKMREVVDINSILDVTPVLPGRGWNELMLYLAKSPYIDVGIISCVSEVASIKTNDQECDDPDGFLTGIKDVVTKYKEFPFVVSIESGKKYANLRTRIEREANVPVFSHADEAARTIARICQSLRK